MEIISNHQWRDFLYRYEVPEKILKDDLDWTTEDDIDKYIKYRDNYYHLDEFERYNDKYWDGCHGDSYFSGILIKVSNDGEQYQIAHYYQ